MIKNEPLITKEHIARINELAAIKKIRALTDEENAEREKLKKLYVAAFRQSLTGTLENIRLVDENGNTSPLKKRNGGHG